MRTGWGAPGCSVSDTRPTPGWRFPARELWCLSFRVCGVQGFVLLFLWEDISWEVVLFCFVCLFVAVELGSERSSSPGMSDDEDDAQEMVRYFFFSLFYSQKLKKA
jgi:hypothetical protein